MFKRCRYIYNCTNITGSYGWKKKRKMGQHTDNKILNDISWNCVANKFYLWREKTRVVYQFVNKLIYELMVPILNRDNDLNWSILWLIIFTHTLLTDTEFIALIDLVIPEEFLVYHH